MSVARRLRIVRDEDPAAGEVTPAPARPTTTSSGDTGDLILVASLFVLNAIPVLGELTGAGRWSSAIVGFAAGALLLTGRELWSQLRPRLRASTGPRSAP